MAATNINRVVLTGNLCADPDLRSLSSGTAVCRLRLAVNTRRKAASGDWEDRPNFFDVTVWGAQGEACAKYLSKGKPVAIDGRLEWREWETEGGGKRQAVQVVADSVQFLGGREDSVGAVSNGGGSRQDDYQAAMAADFRAAASGGGPPPGADEIPFAPSVI